MALFEATGKAQRGRAKLGAGARFLVVAHEGLAEALHIVHVHTHGVAQSVGQEEGVRASLNGGFGVALHQAEVLEAVRHQAAHVVVNVPPAHTRAGVGQGKVVAIDHYIIDVLLALREGARDGRGARMVRAIMLACLGTSVAEQQAASLERACRRITVEDFAVHTDNALEGNHTAVACGNTIQHTAYVGFRHTGAAEAHSRCVHLITDGGSALQFLDFLGRFDEAQLDDSLNEFLRGGIALLRGVYAQEVVQANHRFVAIGRQEVHLAARLLRLGHHFREGRHRRSVCHAAFLGHLHNAGHFAVPDDVVNVNLIAQQGFGAAVGINDAHQAIAVLTEEIEERTVLTEFIRIRRVVHRALVVAHQDNQAVAYQLAQSGAALNVGILGEKHLG